MWHNGYLPGRYQGCPFRSGKEPVFFVSNPEGIDAKTRRRILDAVKALNEREAATTGDPEVTARIHAYEMAARMQTSVPELTDLSKEPADVLEQYGAEPGKESFANNCLLARRLAERGVRFIQLMDSGWDHHNNIPVLLKKKMEEADKPIAALLGDLKQSGLLEDTLVIFCGEFGRTSYCEGPMSFASYGRDHQQLSRRNVLRRRRLPWRLRLRRNRRVGLGRRERPGPRSRRSSNRTPRARPRSPAARDPLPGPRLPSDGRGGKRAEAAAGLTSRRRAAPCSDLKIGMINDTPELLVAARVRIHGCVQ